MSELHTWMVQWTVIVDAEDALEAEDEARILISSPTFEADITDMGLSEGADELCGHDFEEVIGRVMGGTFDGAHDSRYVCDKCRPEVEAEIALTFPGDVTFILLPSKEST